MFNENQTGTESVGNPEPNDAIEQELDQPKAVGNPAQSDDPQPETESARSGG